MQTRKASLVEATTNAAVGFTIATAFNWLFLWFFADWPMAVAAALMTLILTLVSIVRSYALRRFFEGRSQ